MMRWRDTADAPEWVDIRARYKDGTETIGQFYHDDRERIWWDKQDSHREDWPVAWKPLETEKPDA